MSDPAKLPWMKFYPNDWRGESCLRVCSLAARGLWMEMLAVMHEATPRGSLTMNGRAMTSRQMAALAGTSVDQVEALIEELRDAGVFSVDDDGTIYSRRMRRDDRKAREDKANGELGGRPDIRRGTVPKDLRVRRFRRSDAPVKARRIFDRSEGHCHWCHKPLDPENYHIDHVVAVRDGGSNDESNLVAACPDCNGERAMTWGRSDSALMVGKDSDHKAQRPETRDQNSDTSPPSGGEGGEELFESFYEKFPKDETDSPVKAREAFDGLPSDERRALAENVGRIAEHIRRQKLSRPHSVATFLRERKFEGLIAGPRIVVPPRVFVRVDTPQWEAWSRAWRATHGQGPPVQNGGWWFPSEFPPTDQETAA